MKGEVAEEEVAELALEAQRGSEGMEQGATGSGTAADDGATERPPARSFAPSSLGLTVLLPKERRHWRRGSPGETTSSSHCWRRR